MALPVRSSLVCRNFDQLKELFQQEHLEQMVGYCYYRGQLTYLQLLALMRNQRALVKVRHFQCRLRRQEFHCPPFGFLLEKFHHQVGAQHKYR
jgi:hypothetical protein